LFQNVSAIVGPLSPFHECQLNIGFKPEVNADLQASVDSDSAEIASKVRAYYDMGEDCCKLTVDEARCRTYFSNKHLKEFIWWTVGILVLLLVISSLLFLMIGKRIVKDENRHRKLKAMAKWIVLILIILFVLYLIYIFFFMPIE